VEGPCGTDLLEADAIVNAAGPWAGRIASRCGQDVGLQLTKGSILVLAHRLAGAVINRCRPPSSHDIIVPTGTVSLFGTTSEAVDDPGTTAVRPEEIQELLDGATPLIPGIRNIRILRAWAGVRPLVRPKEWPSGAPLPRRHQVIDHGQAGVAGFFTVCGGSLTTHRSMAEDLGDRVCRYLRWNEPCRSATTPIAAGPYWRPAAGYRSLENRRSFEAALCECEAIDGEIVAQAIRSGDIGGLDECRRRLRIGFGPCQGTFCGPRVAGLLAELHPDRDVIGELGAFWAERLKGMTMAPWGNQARQILLNEHVYTRSLGLRLGVGLASGVVPS
jgi:glycerol-3-phosphate dehydrogenase